MTPYRQFIGDTWTFTVIATDGSVGIGSVKMAAGGNSYATPPTVVFDPPPVGGRIATAASIVSGGVVTGVHVVDPGHYTPGSPPGCYLTGGGGNGAIAFPVVGNVVDLTDLTAGAELLPWVTPPVVYDLTQSGNGSVSITDAPHGEIKISVARSLTLQISDSVSRDARLQTRIHVFFTDEDGGRHTVGVIPIQPTKA